MAVLIEEISIITSARLFVLFAVLLLISQASTADTGALFQAEPTVTTPGHPTYSRDVMPAPFTTALAITDDFERDNALAIGGVWTDCSGEYPDLFEPLGIYDGGVVIADPFSRPGAYDLSPPCPQSLKDDHIYPGIGCAFVDTGTTSVSVKVMWSGNHGIDERLHNERLHVEGTPLMYVTPGSSRFGFGAWPSELWGIPVVFAGYIGAPGEQFEVIATAILEGGHESGVPREIELRAETPGEVTVWLDGEQVSFEGEVGLNPIQVDPEMINSTKHGLAVDAHCVAPQSRIPTIKGIESIRIQAIE